MKKLIALIATVALGVSSVFAYTNIITLGLKLGAPAKFTGTASTDELTGEKSPESATFNFNATGLNVGYIGCFDNGFTFKDNTDIGFGTAKTTSQVMTNLPDAKLLNIGVTELLGLGYAFINEDNMFLALYGNFGTDINVALAVDMDETNMYAATVIAPSFLIGADLTFVYTPSNVFSLFASLSGNVGASFVTAASASGTIDSNEIDDPVYAKIFLSKPFLQVIPTLGISWKF